MSQASDFCRIGIATHEADTGDKTCITGDEALKELLIKGFTDIFRKVRTMAPRAMTRTVREIQGECYLARNLLKDYII